MATATASSTPPTTISGKPISATPSAAAALQDRPRCPSQVYSRSSQPRSRSPLAHGPGATPAITNNPIGFCPATTYNQPRASPLGRPMARFLNRAVTFLASGVILMTALADAARADYVPIFGPEFD